MEPIKQPATTQLGDGLYFKFLELQLAVTARRIRADRDTVTSEIEVENFAPAISPMLFTGKFNCLSLLERQHLASYMEKRRDNLPWHDILELVAQRITKTARASNPIKTISSNDSPTEIDFDLYPFIQTDQPTILYGDGGSGKSYLALIMAIVMKLGWHDNNLGMKPKPESKDVLWLDYEASEADFQRRLNRVVKGMGLGEISIDYRSCNQVLADEIEELSILANMRQPGLVVVDSIGAACAGDLHGAEAPTRFFNATRCLPGSILGTFHINKEKELYGNRFFWNFTRHAWEVKKQQAEGDDMVSVGLYHRKANETKRFNSVAYNLLFDDTTTIIEKTDIAEVPELAKGLSLTEQIRQTLVHGAMTIKELADELGQGEASIRTKLNQHKDKFTKTENNRWGLLTNAIP